MVRATRLDAKKGVKGTVTMLKPAVGDVKLSGVTGDHSGQRPAENAPRQLREFCFVEIQIKSVKPQ